MKEVNPHNDPLGYILWFSEDEQAQKCEVNLFRVTVTELGFKARQSDSRGLFLDTSFMVSLQPFLPTPRILEVSLIHFFETGRRIPNPPSSAQLSPRGDKCPQGTHLASAFGCSEAWGRGHNCSREEFPNPTQPELVCLWPLEVSSG